jgi:hypothetical protein
LTARQIARDLTVLIQKAVGGPEILEEGAEEIAAVEDGEEERKLSEEIASLTSDAASGASNISATDSDPTTNSNASAVPPSSS